LGWKNAFLGGKMFSYYIFKTISWAQQVWDGTNFFGGTTANCPAVDMGLQ